MVFAHSSIGIALNFVFPSNFCARYKPTGENSAIISESDHSTYKVTIGWGHVARKQVLTIGLLLLISSASANVIEESELKPISLLWEDDGRQSQPSQHKGSSSHGEEHSSPPEEEPTRRNTIPSIGIGGGTTHVPTQFPDEAHFGNLLGETPDVASKAAELTRFLERFVFDLEQQVANLQYKIDTLLQEEESPEKTPQNSEASVASPWISTPAILVASAAIASVAAYMWVAGSSTAVSSGKKPLFSPLFTRFEGEKVMEHPKRSELYTHIAEKPGIRLQDLCDETSLSRTAVTHHLRLLEQQHVIVSKRVGRSRHFYENGGRYAVHQKEAYALLQNDRAKSIMDTIQKSPGIIQKDICGHLDLQASIAHWHIKRLSEAGLVEPVKQGRTVQYFATNLA